jgi:GntR family transcriptional regulator
MTKNGRNGIPAYKRIQSAIWKRIETGELKPGDMVDSERELARIHQVSLMTARHAVTSLEREGIVERRRSAGTFVAPPKIHFNRLMSYTEQMASRGLVAHSQLLSCKIIDNEPEIAARLALPAHSQLVKVERLRFAGDEAFALEWCYLSAKEFGEIVSAGLGRNSLFSILESNYGIELAYADEEVDATAADPEISELFAIARGTPLLRFRQVIYSTKGKATIYVLASYRSDRHTLQIRRFRSSMPPNHGNLQY